MAKFVITERTPQPYRGAMRAPGDEAIVGRQYRLLERERRVLERLLARMDPDDPELVIVERWL